MQADHQAGGEPRTTHRLGVERAEVGLKARPVDGFG